MSLCKVKKGQNNTKVGTRLFELRKAAGLSLDALSTLSTISKATLSRIENGSTTFEYSHIETLASIFGVQENVFQNTEFTFPSSTQLKNNIKKYIRKNKLEISYTSLFRRKRGASFYVDEMLDGNFLDKKKVMKDITDFCFTEFNVRLDGSAISNVLKRRAEKGIVEIIDEYEYNGFSYKKIK